MNRAEREVMAQVERTAAMMGLPAVRVAEMMAADAAENAREDRRREAERAAAVERAEAAAWSHMHANQQAGLPPDTTMAVRLGMLNPFGDGVTRDARAPYGSASNPAFLVGTDDGGVVDVGYQRQQSAGRAERSFNDAAQDALIARARALSEDSFMKVELARLRQRRAQEAQRAAQVPAAAVATRTETGTGWPEISRECPAEFAIY